MMRVFSFSLLLALFWCGGTLGVKLSDETKAEFPAPLTEDNFNPRAGLQIIEFYSPYCYHCKAFAPVWEEAWGEFYEEGKKLNISLSQVNCVESGDLCRREKIASYPAIRLYGPSGFIKNFPSNIARSKENVIEFARHAANDPDNMEASDVKSVSQLITASKFAHLLAGEGKQPYLLSFLPAKNGRTSTGNIDFENCDECLQFQRSWGILSVKLAALNISTGHINCESSTTICNNLGFSNLAENNNHRADRTPEVALVLPGRATNNLFIYAGPFSSSISVLEDFAKRTYFNSQLNSIKTENILEAEGRDYKIYDSSEGKAPGQRLHIIFSYQPETVVTEDFNFLENLIEPISKIPNAYIYKTEENLTNIVESSFEKMYELINYNQSEIAKLPRQEYMDLNVMPKNPNILVYRDGDRYPHIFRGFSTTELRKKDVVLSWIEQFTVPLVSEITSENFEHFFANPKGNEGLVIVLVNTAQKELTELSNKSLKNLIVGVYDYEHIRMGSMIEDLEEKRTRRVKKATALKENGAETSKILAAAREEIPYKDDKKVQIAFLDISKDKELLKNMGFLEEITQEDIGRVIIIEKDSRKYYKTDLYGDNLEAKPYYVRETLINVLLPHKSSQNKIQGRLINSPYGDSLKILDIVHGHGFFGYAGLLFLIYLLSRGIKFWKRRHTVKKYRAKRNVVGLLGGNDKMKLKE